MAYRQTQCSAMAESFSKLQVDLHSERVLMARTLNKNPGITVQWELWHLYHLSSSDKKSWDSVLTGANCKSLKTSFSFRDESSGNFFTTW